MKLSTNSDDITSVHALPMKLDFLTIHEEITTKNKTYVKNTKIPGKEMWKIP